MLLFFYTLSGSHIHLPDTRAYKKRANLLLFFELCKYFCKNI